MPKERGIIRTLLAMLSCCGVLCLLQCAEKSRREVERPLDAARLIADRINDTQTQAQVLAAVGVKYAELGDYKRPSMRSTRSTKAASFPTNLQADIRRLGIRPTPGARLRSCWRKGNNNSGPRNCWRERYKRLKLFGTRTHKRMRSVRWSVTPPKLVRLIRPSKLRAELPTPSFSQWPWWKLPMVYKGDRSLIGS